MLSLVLALAVGAVSSVGLATAAANNRLAVLATRAFGRVIHDRYGAIHGYWTCPRGQQYGSEISCLAEFRVAERWYSISATAHTSSAPISFARIQAESWRRSWSAYSSRFLRGFDTPGTASVNSPYEDWAFIGAGAYYNWKKHVTEGTVNGYDGQGLGYGRFTLFRCHAAPALVTCTNSFGDSIRYRPRG
jgi:hypothetical protein